MSNFKVWIDNPTTGDAGNVQTSAEYLADIQRINGFQPLTQASSKRVNTALRQTSLVCSALAEVAGVSVDPSTCTTSQIGSELAKYFNTMGIYYSQDIKLVMGWEALQTAVEGYGYFISIKLNNEKRERCIFASCCFEMDDALSGNLANFCEVRHNKGYPELLIYAKIPISGAIRIFISALFATQSMGISKSVAKYPTNAVTHTASDFIYTGAIAPSPRKQEVLWVDTSTTTPLLKYYDVATSTWKVVGTQWLG